MENILFRYVGNKLDTFESGPKQSSPDFFNRDKTYEWELKGFKDKPGFDVSNFTSYINQLNEINGVKRKLYQTKYIIMNYSLIGGIAKIKDYKICNVWDIVSYKGIYPISLQNKKGMWYNIRPCSFKEMDDSEKTPEKFIDQICKAIKKCPNKIENKDTIIKNIKKQFEKLRFDNVMDEMQNLLISDN